MVKEWKWKWNGNVKGMKRKVKENVKMDKVCMYALYNEFKHGLNLSMRIDSIISMSIY